MCRSDPIHLSSPVAVRLSLTPSRSSADLISSTPIYLHISTAKPSLVRIQVVFQTFFGPACLEFLIAHRLLLSIQMRSLSCLFSFVIATNYRLPSAPLSCPKTNESIAGRWCSRRRASLCTRPLPPAPDSQRPSTLTAAAVVAATRRSSRRSPSILCCSCCSRHCCTTTAAAAQLQSPSCSLC